MKVVLLLLLSPTVKKNKFISSFPPQNLLKE